MNGLQAAFYICMVVSAFTGWAIIETIIWLFSFITISFGVK